MTVCMHVKEGSSNRLRCVQQWIFWLMCCFLEGLVQQYQAGHQELPFSLALQNFWSYKHIFHHHLSGAACQLASLLKYVDTVGHGFLVLLCFPEWLSLLSHWVLVTEGILPSWVCGTIEIIEWYLLLKAKRTQIRPNIFSHYCCCYSAHNCIFMLINIHLIIYSSSRKHRTKQIGFKIHIAEFI